MEKKYWKKLENGINLKMFEKIVILNLNWSNSTNLKLKCKNR